MDQDVSRNKTLLLKKVDKAKGVKVEIVVL